MNRKLIHHDSYHEYYIEETSYTKEKDSETLEIKYWKGKILRNGKEIREETTKEELKEFERKWENKSKEWKNYEFQGTLKNFKRKWIIYHPEYEYETTN